MISVVAVAIIAAAIIIILSIFNGLTDVLHDLNNSFDPEIKIEAAKGKSFPVDKAMLASLQKVNGVQNVVEVIEDYAYARYNQANQAVTIKGVSDNFIAEKRIPEEKIVQGEFKLTQKGTDYALLGYAIAEALSVDPGNDFFPLQLYYIKNLKSGTLNPSELYTQKNIQVGGTFSIVQNFDEKYVIVPLHFAQDLLNYGNKRTSLEIKIAPGATIGTVENDLQQLLGSDFKVLNSEEQHEDLYRVVKWEKLFATIASVLLLVIGSINIYFNLMMLALDKKKDLSVLASCGADSKLLQRVFVFEGLLIALIGTLSGLALGALVVFVQQQFGLVSMGMEASVVEGYPVKLQVSDFVYVALTMTTITVLISSRPAVLAARFASAQHL